jgi:acetoin utilization protein AcuB
MTSRGAAGRWRETPAWPVAVPVQTWMHGRVATVRPHTLVSVAARTMRQRKIRHLPVVDARRAVVGIVTERDLRQAVVGAVVAERVGPAIRALAGLRVRDVMTWAVLTVRPDTDVRDAARMMRERAIGALPVVERGRLVGIVTEHDLLAALEDALRREVTTVRPLRAAGASADWDYGFPPPARAGAED